VNPSQGPPPLDPYYGGMYIDDGAVKNHCICQSDEETEVWIGEYATRLNAAKEEGYRDVELTKLLTGKKGEPIHPGSSYLRKRGVCGQRGRKALVASAERAKRSWYL
jgi:hypothetical protein